MMAIGYFIFVGLSALVALIGIVRIGWGKRHDAD